ncbi:MAG: hypothetical protein ABIQ30_17200 [Devosia sp.]
MPDDRPGPESVRAAMEELLGWQGISRSPQLAQLLRYIVEKTLAGDEAAIKAYSIAVDVFGRPQSFDPQADPIVRVQARRLRTLLEQFYVTGASRCDVQIHLPLGRYVPEFARVALTSQSVSPPDPALLDGAPKPRRRPHGLIDAAYGMAFTLIGVGLAFVIFQWLASNAGQAPNSQPDFPSVSVGAFSNLTGQAVLDDDVAAVGVQLAAALGKFDTFNVVASGGAVITGVVQEQLGRFVVNAILTPPQGDGIAWSTSIIAMKGVRDTEALEQATILLAAQLASPTGPLHAPGRAWLKQQAALPDQPQIYTCLLRYMAWRDTRQLADADSGTACFDRVLKTDPENAYAIASGASLRAWRVQYFAGPGDDITAQLRAEAEVAAHAVALRPGSSFVREQQALVFAWQAAITAAVAAAQKAVELNPASSDASALLGVLRWLNGEYETGRLLGERAITEVSSAPPWYYMTRAFDAMREQRYFDAIDAALALAQGDDELGPVIVLAAAPRIGRTDLIDLYRPILLANAHLQSAGIMPRITAVFRPEGLANRVREGLTLAGIPPNALVAPFNADGTPK